MDWRTLVNKLVAVVLFAACTGGPSEPPSPTPPPAWGVPISGGTLLAARDGKRAVIADPDRDRILIVDLGKGKTTAELALTAEDEPGRLVEDGAGRFHVALRRGGALVTIAGTEIIDRRAVCAEPRGVAWDPVTDLVHVACSGGELVSL